MPDPESLSPLRQLAARAGIIDEYEDQTGKEKRRTTDETRRALLRVLGFDVSTDGAIRDALRAWEQREAARLLDPVAVIPRRGRGLPRATVRIPPDADGENITWTLTVRAESGETHEAAGRGREVSAGELEVKLPFDPGLGYHEVRFLLDAGGGRTWEGKQRLIIVPRACPKPESVTGRRRMAGIIANLYTVRSKRYWGIGDLTDLAALARWAGGAGASFVGVNPLHALRNRGIDISPYSPVSRLFRNPIYIDPMAVPERRHSDLARECEDSPQTLEECEKLRAADRVEYARVVALKRPVLLALHGTFVALHRGRDTERGRAYDRYLAQMGRALDNYATYCAIAEWLERRGDRHDDWRAWPDDLRDAESPAVASFRVEHAQAVDFHRWLQFELDRQLAAAQQAALDAGQEIGLYQDLAIGTSPTGADTWAFRHLFASGASVGAPPDPYSATGQNWGLPPLDPHRLRESGYEYWTLLVRNSLRHAGALRMDHVMGLFRQFWIPEGKTGKEGAYVRFPSEELLGILALEAERANAIVVGEDLGTVPPEVPPALEQWGILSSKVLWFEKTRHERFRAASSYGRRALATANTHDLPTIAGFWLGRDIELRREAGLCDEQEAAEARASREKEREALLDRLVEERVMRSADAKRLRSTEPDALSTEDMAMLRGAVHAFLCKTPSVLVGLMLDDLVGEVEPVNLPGVGPDQYPSWTRKLRLSLEEIATDASVEQAMRCRRLE